MICPKCEMAELEEGSKNRWFCPYIYPNKYKVTKKKDGTEAVKEIKGQPCNFACGLAFFIEDENASIKSEVGLSIEDLDLSDRAREILDSGVLHLGDIDQDEAIISLESVQRIEAEEDEWNEFNLMMREVVGRSAGVHRTLSNGESYRKMKSGGLITQRAGQDK